MCFKLFLRASLIACALSVQCAFADGSRIAHRPLQADAIDSAAPPAPCSAQTLIDRALELIRVRYRRGGDDAASGFDCSGFVDHVFREALGMSLPHSSRAISNTGSSVSKDELKPGDLVLFRNLRNVVSHSGIYVRDHRFVHVPRPGVAVGVAELRERHWVRRYVGARRVEVD